MCSFLTCHLSKTKKKKSITVQHWDLGLSCKRKCVYEGGEEGVLGEMDRQEVRVPKPQLSLRHCGLE